MRGEIQARAVQYCAGREMSRSVLCQPSAKSWVVLGRARAARHSGAQAGRDCLSRMDPWFLGMENHCQPSSVRTYCKMFTRRCIRVTKLAEKRLASHIG